MIQTEAIKTLLKKKEDIQHLGLLLLSRDPVYGKIPKDKRSELISLADAEGIRQAHVLGERYPDMDIAEIVKSFGMQIEYTDDRNVFMGMLVHCEYYSNSKRIRIYNKSLKKFQNLIKDYELGDSSQLKEIYIAHEFYHFWEEEQSKSQFSSSYKVTTFKVGPIKNTSTVIALSELAAQCFAKEFIGLSYYPMLLDELNMKLNGPPRPVVQRAMRYLKNLITRTPYEEE